MVSGAGNVREAFAAGIAGLEKEWTQYQDCDRMKRKIIPTMVAVFVTKCLTACMINTMRGEYENG